MTYELTVGCERKRLCYNLSYYHDIYLEGLRRNTISSVTMRSVDPQLKSEVSNLADVAEVLYVFK